MTLTKALKQKNRLTQKMSDIQQEIQRENSVRADDSRKIDVGNLMANLFKTRNDLIRLKIAIFVASTSMRENILVLGELKSHIIFLRGISTREGFISDYGDKEIKYTVVFDKLYIKTEIEDCEKQIDNIQDKLDTFNHKTEVII